MQEVFEKIKQRIMIAATEACGYAPLTRAVAESELKDIMEQIAAEYNNGWIPCSVELPPQPKENPVFDSKPLELYLVDCGEEYSFRAFWNGKDFTDGWSKLNVIAWQPLPEPYQPKGDLEEWRIRNTVINADT